MIDRTNQFILLLRILGMKTMDEENLEMAKFIISIGEAVYSAWLGAFAEDRVHRDLLDTCPYDHSELEWRGAYSHSSLLEVSSRLSISMSGR
jgi:hypothetical protein